jgi:hypothetical protein
MLEQNPQDTNTILQWNWYGHYQGLLQIRGAWGIGSSRKNKKLISGNLILNVFVNVVI